MGLLDPFRPKWKHSDWRVREAAVKRLTDGALLADIAVRDSSKEVRLAAALNARDGAFAQAVFGEAANDTSISSDRRLEALEALTDPATLETLAKTPHHPSFVRLAAALKTGDQEVLAEIAQAARETDVRRQAIRGLTDQALLAGIAENHDDLEVRKIAVGNLADQKALARIAQEDENHRMRQIAAGKLTDQALLAAIARTDDDLGVREAASGNLTDQKALARIAQEDENHRMRQIAIHRLTDQVLLAEIAEKHSDLDVRKAAVENLTDQNALARIAKDESHRLRRIAVGKLADQALLAQIAEDDDDLDVRRAAVGNLTDQNTLARIAPDLQQKLTARKAVDVVIRTEKDRLDWSRAVAGLTDAACLADLARNAKDPDIRATAVGNPRLTNQAVLAEIAIHPAIIVDEWEPAVEAVKRLADQALLAKVAQAANNPFIRHLAIDKISDQGLLAQVATTNSEADLRLRAAHRLADRALAQTICVDIAMTDSGCAPDAIEEIEDESALVELGVVSDGRTRKAVAHRLGTLGWNLTVSRSPSCSRCGGSGVVDAFVCGCGGDGASVTVTCQKGEMTRVITYMEEVRAR